GTARWITFYDATFGDLKVEKLDPDGGNGGGDVIAEAGDVGRLVSVRAPISSSADVAYYNATDGTIRRVTGTFESWSSTDVIPAGMSVQSLSYADSSGYRRVAFYDGASADLMFARVGPGATSVVPVDVDGDVGRSCSAAIGPDGVTHIAYYDA